MHEQQCHKLTACDAQSPLLGHEKAALLVEGGFLIYGKRKAAHWSWTANLPLRLACARGIYWWLCYFTSTVNR